MKRLTLKQLNRCDRLSHEDGLFREILHEQRHLPGARNYVSLVKRASDDFIIAWSMFAVGKWKDGNSVVGVFVDKKFRRNGYARESLTALCNFVKTKLRGKYPRVLFDGNAPFVGRIVRESNLTGVLAVRPYR